MTIENDINLIVKNTPFDKLKDKRILITGGSGFVGHWMSLVPDAVTVRALNHQQYDYSKWYLQDWDYIIHLANVPPTRVIECARRCHATILYSSSGSVTVDEQPGEYTRGKRRAEEELLASGLDVRIARMYTFTGGWMKNHFAVINMVTDAIAGLPITIYAGRMSVTRSYMYAADLAIWLWRILLNGRRGKIYDVGSPQPVDMITLAREVQKNFDPPPAIEHYPVYFNEPRPYYVPAFASSTMSELDLEVYTPFDEAIKRTVDWYRRDVLYG